MKPHRLKHILLPFLLLFLLSMTGCLETLSNFDIDPVVMRANPYLNKLALHDEDLQIYASSIIQICEKNTSACILNSIYRHIVENYEYIADPEDEEIIQTPQETITKKGGDCEDLTILLISLLENIGLDSYLVLTDTHAYALAIDINPDLLWPYIEESLIAQVEQDNDEEIRQNLSDTFTLNGKSSWYYGGKGESLSESFSSLTFTYTITATRPIDFYVVSSQEDFHSFANDSSFTHFPECTQRQQTQITGNCTIQTSGGIILSNNGFRSTKITLDLEQYFKPSFYNLFKNNTISTYTINKKQSVVLDPTAGVYGYPGYDAELTGEKIAFNPKTKEYVYLE